MERPIRWGVLGAARFAREHMARAIHAAEGAKLSSLATSSPEKAAGFQAFCPDLRIHANYVDLLADPEIDAVYVPLPNHLHVEWTLKALDAGKHVLTEKPLCLKAGEFDQVIAKRDETGLLAAEAYMIVHHPQWIRARELYRAGAIGRLAHVDGFFSYDNRTDPGNIRNRSETGGGALPDIGVYTCGSARFVSGEEPEGILSADIRWENDVDVTSHVCARFSSFVFSAGVSMRLYPRQEMTFHGEKGIMRLVCPFNANVFGEARILLEKEAMTVSVERFPADNHYVRQVENFGRAIRDGKPYPCPLEFSKGTQRMIDMIYDAAGR